MALNPERLASVNMHLTQTDLLFIKKVFEGVDEQSADYQARMNLTLTICAAVRGIEGMYEEQVVGVEDRLDLLDVVWGQKEKLREGKIKLPDCVQNRLAYIVRSGLEPLSRYGDSPWFEPLYEDMYFISSELRRRNSDLDVSQLVDEVATELHASIGQRIT